MREDVVTRVGISGIKQFIFDAINGSSNSRISVDVSFPLRNIVQTQKVATAAWLVVMCSCCITCKKYKITLIFMLKYTENCLIAMSAAFTTRYDNYLENRYGSNLISVNCFYVEFVENGNMQLNAILL